MNKLEQTQSNKSNGVHLVEELSENSEENQEKEEYENQNYSPKPIDDSEIEITETVAKEIPKEKEENEENLKEKIQTILREKEEMEELLIDQNNQIKALQDINSKYENYFKIFSEKLKIKIETEEDIFEKIDLMNEEIERIIKENKKFKENSKGLKIEIPLSPKTYTVKNDKSKFIKYSFGSKENEVNALKSKIKTYLSEIYKLKQANETYAVENQRMTEDINFYKETFEIMKKEKAKENSMISNALYDLALHFTIIKNQVSKELEK